VFAAATLDTTLLLGFGFDSPRRTALLAAGLCSILGQFESQVVLQEERDDARIIQVDFTQSTQSGGEAVVFANRNGISIVTGGVVSSALADNPAPNIASRIIPRPLSVVINNTAAGVTALRPPRIDFWRQRLCGVTLRAGFWAAVA
jgi:hypothetical protein